jgi:thiamine biosynthesis protein ThiS
MILRVNGKEKTFSAKPENVTQLLDALGVKTQLAAVEINGDIVSSDLFPQTTLHEGDKIEIVSFVGGG